MAIYDVGDKIRISFSFVNSAGAAADPTSVVLKIKNGNTVVKDWTFGVDPEVINDAVGLYRADFVIGFKGYYSYNVTGSGIVFAADTGFFIAKE